MLAGDKCPDVGPDASSDPKDRNCSVDSFWSARNQRSILYSGNDVPRLYNGEPARVGPVINADAANPPSRVMPPIVAFSGTMRSEINVDSNAVDSDIANLRIASAKRFDANERVKIDFTRATLDFMLQQLLSGALGVNYVTSEALGGSVTFRTEEPIPKNQVLLVVRDVLARNGYAMRLINGVYHIGRPDVIAAVEQANAAGQNAEMVTRVVRLSRGSAPEVVNLGRQLFPDNISLSAGTVARTIIVKAPPADIDQVEETLKTLATSGATEDRLAIIQLSQAAPERIAIQVSELYKSRLPPGADQPTIIPLDRQQALLVATRDPGVMEGIRTLARALDRESADEPTLRVIPLQHVQAEEIAQRLAGLFGNGSVGGTAPVGGRGNGGRSNGTQDRSQPLFPPGQLSVPGRQSSPLRDDDEGGSIAPAMPPAPNGGASRNGQTVRVDERSTTVSSGGVGGPLAVRIVADTRSNSIMIHSTLAVYKRVRDVLRALDIPQSQVAIEATVVEVELNDRLERGVQFFLQSPYVNARSSVEPVAADVGKQGGFLQVGANFGKYRVDAVLNALQQVTKVKVISSPYLTVVDTKTARLVIGDQIPYTSRSQTSQNTGNVTVTQEVEIKDTGIILEVTPRINADNSVSLKINQQVSTPSPTVQAGNTTPVIATRSVDSNVLVQSGRTILLGGLIQDRIEQTDTGVPVLRKIPAVGDLFKSDDDKVRRVELMVLIKPRVSRQSSQIEDISRLIKSQLHTR